MSNLLNLGDLVYLSYPVVPIRALFAIARLHAGLRYRVKGELRAAVRRNLASADKAFTDSDLDTRTRLFFEYSRLRNLMFILAPKMTDEQLDRYFGAEGIENLDRAIAGGKGVILLTSHMNSISIFPLIMRLRRRGYDLRVALSDERDPWAPTVFRAVLNRLTGQRRYLELLGAFYGQFNIRPIVRALGEGAIVLQTGDGWHSAGIVEVDFLNRRLPFTTGMIRIAQQTGVPIVPIFGTGTPPDGMKLVIEEPFWVSKDEPVEPRVAAYARRLEYYVLKNPECWEHWWVPDALKTLEGWSQRTLRERYDMGH